MGENDAKTLQVDANFLKTEKKKYTDTCGHGQCEIFFFPLSKELSERD